MVSKQRREQIWELWQAGDSFAEIARRLDISPGTAFNVIQANGGVTPAKRCRSARHLTLEEREEISRGLTCGESLTSIAGRLGRHRSTISREVDRNGGPQDYRAAAADRRAWQRGRRPKDCKLARQPALCHLVSKKLADDWSPEQISGWLAVEYHGDHTMQVSHETIYLSLFIQSRGVLNAELKQHLRSRRTTRRVKGTSRKNGSRGSIQNAVSIRDRPPEVEDRAIPGHWEGDLLAGSKNSHIATLVERTSRFTLLIKTDSKDAQTVTEALRTRIQALPEQLRKSLTWDRGSELAKHQELTLATRIDIYFCDPQSPWQLRHERKHKRATETVLPEEDRSRWLRPGPPGCHRPETQHPTPQGPRLPDPRHHPRRRVALTG